MLANRMAFSLGSVARQGGPTDRLLFAGCESNISVRGSVGLPSAATKTDGGSEVGRPDGTNRGQERWPPPPLQCLVDGGGAAAAVGCGAANPSKLVDSARAGCVTFFRSSN